MAKVLMLDPPDLSPHVNAAVALGILFFLRVTITFKSHVLFLCTIVNYM
jgi:hypothetical protein